MDYIFALLAKMKERYAAYIGGPNIHKLSIFLGGYECALFELLGVRAQFDSRFQRYCEEKYHCDNGKHRDVIICENTSDAAAFDAFWIDLEEFKLHTNFCQRTRT